MDRELIEADRRRTVLIFTASVGGGHEAAGRVLRDEIEQAGHRAVVVDGLSRMGRRPTWILVHLYAWLLAHAPWSYDVAFRVGRLRPVSAATKRLVGRLWGKHLLGAVQTVRPDVIVSTYPFVTAALGRLIRNGRLKTPIVAVIPDFGVHPMWVTSEAALHLVPSRPSAELAQRAGGRARLARLPVAGEFRIRQTRVAARAGLGLPQDAFVPLIVGGAWGVGDIEGAADCAVAARVVPVIVTGQNGALRRRLEARYGSEANVRVLGWTDQMPALMTAADCLIQNAGGVTCLEAMEVELPILIFRPIPGHGVLNAVKMEEAGVARLIATAGELRELLRAAAAGQVALRAPRPQFGCAVVPTVLAACTASPRPAPRLRVPLRRPLVAVAAIALMLWISMSSWGITLATERGHLTVLGYDAPPGKVAVVVRAVDPVVAGTLERVIVARHLPAALFVDAAAARGLTPDPQLTFGVAQDPGERRLVHPIAVWDQSHDAAEALEQATGRWPAYFLPSAGNMDLLDLALKPRHARLVMSERTPGHVPRSGVVIVDTTGMDGETATAALTRQIDAVLREGSTCVPLSALS